MLWTISGPSSAGKSHLLATPRAQELTGLGPSTPVLFPPKIGKTLEIEGDAFLHYNLLRPAMAAFKRDEDPAAALDFSLDDRWMRAVEAGTEMSAIVLVADKSTLMDRANGRDVNEPGGKRRYKRTKWLALFEQIDLDAVYDAWRGELGRRGIPFIEVDSTRDEFPVLEAKR